MSFARTSVEMLLLTKWLGWELFLTVEITLARPPFTFLFTCLILSHSALLSEPVFLSRRAPAVSGWSETRCDQPNVILMYQQNHALSVFNLHNHFILLKQCRASFFLLLGNVVIKSGVFWDVFAVSMEKTKQWWLSYEPRFRHRASCWLRLLLHN